MHIKSFLFLVLVGMVACTNYYPSGIFDTTQYPAFTRSQGVNTEESSDKDGNFQYNLKAIINIRK